MGRRVVWLWPDIEYWIISVCHDRCVRHQVNIVLVAVKCRLVVSFCSLLSALAADRLCSDFSKLLFSHLYKHLVISLPYYHSANMSGFDPSMIPLASAPPGQTSDLFNAPSRAWVPRLAIYSTLPVAVAFVVMRLYARLRSRMALGWDDCEVLFPV